jgi:hypothetical protein
MSDTEPPVLMILILLGIYVLEFIFFPIGGGGPIETYADASAAFTTENPFFILIWFGKMLTFQLPAFPVPLGAIIAMIMILCVAWVEFSLLSKIRDVVGPGWVGDVAMGLIAGITLTTIVAGLFSGTYDPVTTVTNATVAEPGATFTDSGIPEMIWNWATGWIHI